MDHERIYPGMERPAFLVDGRNHLDAEKLDAEKLYRIGFNVYAIGRPDPDRSRL